MSQALLRHLPAVGAVLSDPRVAPLAGERARAWLTRLVQREIAAERERLLASASASPAASTNAGDTGPERADLLDGVVIRVLEARERLLRPTLRRVINATGVIVHTNLGRSLFPDLALEWLTAAARHPVDLEYRLDTGARGHRGRGVEAKAALLCGADDALVINNNAAALWLAVRVCAGGGRVILSRGEVVAIGGSFRLHEILRETGCALVEIGTTNRTRLQDYRDALTPDAVVLKVHRSNFAVSGFTEEVSLVELGELCRASGHTLIHDAGSGALYPFAELGLPGEPTLADDLAAGADIVTASGDKLLGGCQAGLALGKRELIERMRHHPMRRAFRVDKLTLAALDAVLTLYIGADGRPAVPTLEMVATPVELLAARAERLLATLVADAPKGWRGEVAAGESSVGGGSFSEAAVPTCLLLWRAPKEALERCHASLRRQDPAVVTRIGQDGLGVDLRTVAPEEDTLVVDAFRRVWKER